MDLLSFKPGNPDSKIKILIFTHLSSISKASPQVCWLSIDIFFFYFWGEHMPFDHICMDGK